MEKFSDVEFQSAAEDNEVYNSANDLNNLEHIHIELSSKDTSDYVDEVNARYIQVGNEAKNDYFVSNQVRTSKYTFLT